MNVLVLLGSLRADSSNRRLAEAAIAHLPAGAAASIVTGGDLPFYSEDLDVEPVPAAVADFRAAVEATDAVLVVTPEYNGSLSGVLKNALDWASRPRGNAALAGKPAAVLAASGSPRGAQWAREDAVKVLRVAGADVVEDTVGLGSSWTAFDAEGRLTDLVADAAVAELVDRLASAETLAA